MAKINVVAYAAAIPPNNTNLEKPLILQNFCEGVNLKNDTALYHKSNNVLDCDLAILQGFVHEKGKTAPHLNLRKEVLNYQTLRNKHTLIADSNLFLYKNTKNPLHYLRYSFDGVFPTTGYYFTEKIDSSRWEKIKKNLNVTVEPWRSKGDHILICLQRNGGWSMQGTDSLHWLDSTINEIRQYSDRPIIIRQHPGDKKTKVVTKYKNTFLSAKENLTEDLKNAWATITYNSSPGVASAIEGIPVFVLDPNYLNSQASDIANTLIKNIENPMTPERDNWLKKISMCHWNFDELKSGEAWEFIRQFV